MSTNKVNAEQLGESVKGTGLFKGMEQKPNAELPNDQPKAEPVTDQEPEAKAKRKRTAKPKTKDAKPEETKTADDTGTKGKESPVSIWLSSDTKKRLKAMSRATGKSVSSLVNAAVQAHLDGYQLSEDEQ